MRFKPTKENAFGLDPWKLVDDTFTRDRTDLQHKEAALAQGNGFIGMRSTYDERISEDEWESYNACFLNGSFEYEDILYTHRRKGLTAQAQVMLRIPDWHMISLVVDGETFSMPSVNVLSAERVLDMKTAIISREVEWETKTGKKIKINSKRIISLTRKQSCTVEYSVSSDKDAQIELTTEMDGDIKNLFSKNKFLSIANLQANENIQQLELVTERSNQRIVMASLFNVNGSSNGVNSSVEGSKTISKYSTPLKAGESLDTTKFVNIILAEKDDTEIIKKAVEGVINDSKDGFELLETEQKAYWDKFWKNADVVIDGNDSIQQGIRYCMMQLVQNSGKDGKTNIGAKGLTGYNYAGKCFWDTEIYMQPILLNAQPELAKNLIDFRYNTLDKAREQAKTCYIKGALYPWETINGEECSFLFEAATAQYHLQCAVGLSIKNYYTVTNDFDYMSDKCLEILMETSRCLFDVGSFIPARGNQFCMNCVCGPDEYSPVVDNNCYTNTMTMHHFDFTLQMIDKLNKLSPEKLLALKEKINLTDDEISNWKKAKENMYIPYSEEHGIHLQDDQFLYRDPVDLEKWMKTDEYKKHEIHPLNLWRLQLLKQADVVLLMVLRSKDYSLEQKKKNYEFYEPKTINDSSLSPCAYSIAASEIGIKEHVLPYLNYTVRLDLDNYQGTGSGIHTASMGGAWLSIVQGIAGIALQDGEMYMNPKFPEEWNKLEFKYRFNNSHVNIKLNKEKTEITLLEGEGFDFEFKGTNQSVSKEQSFISIEN